MITILAATFITVIVINPSEGRGLGHDGIDYGARIQERHDDIYRWGTSPYQGLPYDSRFGRHSLDGYRRHDRRSDRHERHYDRRDGYQHYRSWGGGYGGGAYSTGPATGYE